jgi:virginiamycin A acetyltransferase
LRYGLKRTIVYALHLLTWPAGLSARWAHAAGSEGLFDFWAKLLSLVPGAPGQYLRTSYYVQTLTRCPCDLSVAFGSFFSHPEARIGRSVVIGSYSIIGQVELEDDVMIASHVSILSGKYQHGQPLRGDDTASFTPVTIGAGSWLGQGSIVMASLGRKCVVSAGSVVTRPAPEGSIAVGNPARFLLPGAS